MNVWERGREREIADLSLNSQLRILGANCQLKLSSNGDGVYRQPHDQSHMPGPQSHSHNASGLVDQLSVHDREVGDRVVFLGVLCFFIC